MVDYKKIVDAYELATYTDVDEAFAAMSAMEVAGEHKVLSGSLLRIWAAMNQADYNIIKANAATDVLAEMAMMLLENPVSTLSMSDPRVQGMISGLGISQEGQDALYAEAAQTIKVWPGLKPGHIQNALEKRAEGVI